MRIHTVTTEAELDEAREIRRRVFITEQGCSPEEEYDEHDRYDEHDGAASPCRHFLGRAGGRPVATARWRPVEIDGRPAAKLERFAVLAPWRGAGHGRALLHHLLEDARRAGHDTFFVHAQTYLEAFYTSFGFTAFGEPFLEAGIPHVKMLRREG